MDKRHRGAIRQAAHGMRRIGADLAHGRGHVPRDEPAGYVAAFTAELRALAGVLEALPRDAGVVQAKRRALRVEPSEDPATALARRRAANAALTLINQEAARAGLDPYIGMKEPD